MILTKNLTPFEKLKCKQVTLMYLNVNVLS